MWTEKILTLKKDLEDATFSAAAITRDTVAISVTVSESGGVLRVYKDAKETLCMEALQPASRYI
jgi:hypothetical protein